MQFFHQLIVFEEAIRPNGLTVRIISTCILFVYWFILLKKYWTGCKIYLHINSLKIIYHIHVRHICLKVEHIKCCYECKGLCTTWQFTKWRSWPLSLKNMSPSSLMDEFCIVVTLVQVNKGNNSVRLGVQLIHAVSLRLVKILNNESTLSVETIWVAINRIINCFFSCTYLMISVCMWTKQQ